jgi:hypothetical protein
VPASSYRVAPIFLIRPAGVPFEHLERLATRQTAGIARELLGRRDELIKSRRGAEEFVGARSSGLSADESRRFRAVLRDPASLNGEAREMPPAMSQFARIAVAVRALEAELDEMLQNELTHARAALMKSARGVLPGYLVFGAG